MKSHLCDLADSFTLPAGEWLEIELAEGGHWFGHGFHPVQPWPLERGVIENPNFAVNNIQCPAWMCSAGVVLFADTLAPLEVGINGGGNGKLQIRCVSDTVTFQVFRGKTLPAAQRDWLRSRGWPNRPPTSRHFGDCFFCTWTQYPRCITQSRILDMARQIRTHGYPCHTLIIDDRWERCFGELEFNAHDFPAPRAMFQELKRLDFEPWLWITPFVNIEAANFADLERRGILVADRSGGAAARLKWWGGTAGLVDLTSPQGRDWYRGKLQALLDLGAAGFKIDGGDHKYHPPAERCAWHRPPGASGYSDLLLALVEERVPNRCETRTAWCSQGRSVLWREGGKDSHWGLDNGLKAVVTLGMHVGLLGYDLLIPDMAPGRVQTMKADDPLPTDELMVRWTEVSSFFPFLQFSYFPWNYASSTAQAVATYAQVHKALEPYLVEHAAMRSAPLLRPLWYDYPEEKALYPIADTFMLGPDLIVAPVLDPGVTARDVVLPPGVWRDAWSGQPVARRLESWPAPCPGIPLFVHDRNPALLDVLMAALALVRRGSVDSGLTTATWQAGLDRDLKVTG
jgi:alpha-glucosidase (family GH31 glycosyl hydrolase)